MGKGGLGVGDVGVRGEKINNKIVDRVPSSNLIGGRILLGESLSHTPRGKKGNYFSGDSKTRQPS